MENKTGLEPGDYVEVLVDVKDEYREICHHKGFYEKVQSIASDGEGVIFASSCMGTHFKNVKKIDIFNELNALKGLNYKLTKKIYDIRNVVTKL